MSPLEVWGGIECTVNRIGECYLNQLERSGHASRIGDLNLIAGLGIRTLRYPVLWEVSGDFSWARQRLARLRELGIAPILGLVHHGSGPRHTSLIDESFAPGLAAYAASVAAEFPWVEAYTPVNEPLTTARFSGLYGHWYPHHRDDRSFARALLNQCHGTALAMQAIRRVNASAKFVQTEDLGRIHSTLALAAQADFENERRWLTWDLLCGRVGRDHPLYGFLLGAGIGVGELAWFEEHPCPPDLIGVNHYVTSERFLDERPENYPPQTWGGNGRVRYADVDAVRVQGVSIAGWRGVLQEAWVRYRRPIALTEVHLGCTREEQLRWFCEAWKAAGAARQCGCDIRAVTAWALLGSYDWNALLTRQTDHYEAGAFDLRSGVPRPTVLARTISGLTRGASPSHSVLSSAGWWRKPCRILYGSANADCPHPARAPERGRPILVTGGHGTLGSAFGRICAERGLAHRLCTRAELEICNSGAIEQALDGIKPWAVVNAAGYVRVDEAEHDRERCFRENACGPRMLAMACERRRLPLLTFSSDLVFDGSTSTPYVETHPVAPLNVYGRSKVAGEAAVLKHHPESLIIRTSSFFGIWDRHNFISLALRALAQEKPITALDDVIVSPTFVPDLVHACLDLLVDGEQGVWHLANRGQISWVELARRAAALVGIDASRLEPRRSGASSLVARRPAFSALGSERGMLLPRLDDALERYAAHARVSLALD